jgi:hypothetical protein
VTQLIIVRSYSAWVYQPLPTICGGAHPQRLLSLVCCDTLQHNGSINTDPLKQQQQLSASAGYDDSDSQCLPTISQCYSACCGVTVMDAVDTSGNKLGGAHGKPDVASRTGSPTSKYVSLLKRLKLSN